MLPIREWAVSKRPDLTPHVADVLARNYCRAGRLAHRRDKLGHILIEESEPWPVLMRPGAPTKAGIARAALEVGNTITIKGKRYKRISGGDSTSCEPCAFIKRPECAIVADSCERSDYWVKG